MNRTWTVCRQYSPSRAGPEHAGHTGQSGSHDTQPRAAARLPADGMQHRGRLDG